MPWYIAYRCKTHKGTLEEKLQHKDIRYFILSRKVERLEDDRMVMRDEKVVSNLIFLKTDSEIHDLIRHTDGLRSPYYNLFTHQPAVVNDAEMERFIHFMEVYDAGATILKDPFRKFTKHQHVRVKAGEFKGMEGYVVRINRDRKLVIALDTMAVAISGIHYTLLEPINEQ